MKRAKQLLPQIVDRDNLRLAFWKASKGKRHSHAVLAYQAELEANLATLQGQINAARLEVGDYHYFLIYEPKEREICGSAFSEQVLHHALMNACHPYFENAQIADSYASRKGKGTYAALDRGRQFTKQYQWYLKLDVRKFFASIHHDVLKQQLDRRFKETALKACFYQIIDSYESAPNRGLPIGNLTSQYFANHYLSGVDHFIKDELGFKGYVRYMDDMVLWASNKKPLLAARDAIEYFLSERLRLATKPCQINKSHLGLPFLGYRIFPYKVLLLQKSKQRFIKKASKIIRNYQSDECSGQDAHDAMNALLAFVNYADAKGFRGVVPC
jgi:retron-type reverse transcriptase